MASREIIEAHELSEALRALEDSFLEGYLDLGEFRERVDGELRRFRDTVSEEGAGAARASEYAAPEKDVLKAQAEELTFFKRQLTRELAGIRDAYAESRPLPPESDFPSLSMPEPEFPEPERFEPIQAEADEVSASGGADAPDLEREPVPEPTIEPGPEPEEAVEAEAATEGGSEAAPEFELELDSSPSIGEQTHLPDSEEGEGVESPGVNEEFSFEVESQEESAEPEPAAAEPEAVNPEEASSPQVGAGMVPDPEVLAELEFAPQDEGEPEVSELPMPGLDLMQGADPLPAAGPEIEPQFDTMPEPVYDAPVEDFEPEAGDAVGDAPAPVSGPEPIMEPEPVAEAPAQAVSNPAPEQGRPVPPPAQIRAPSVEPVPNLKQEPVPAEPALRGLAAAKPGLRRPGAQPQVRVSQPSKVAVSGSASWETTDDDIALQMFVPDSQMDFATAGGDSDDLLAGITGGGNGESSNSANKRLLKMTREEHSKEKSPCGAAIISLFLAGAGLLYTGGTALGVILSAAHVACLVMAFTQQSWAVAGAGGAIGLIGAMLAYRDALDVNALESARRRQEEDSNLLAGQVKETRFSDKDIRL